MLLKQTGLKIIFYSTIFGLSALLSSCGNSQQLEQFLSADPNLKPKTETTTTKISDSKTTENQNSESNITASPQKGIQLTKLPKGESSTQPELNNQSDTNQEDSKQPFADLPDSLPFYPQATLESIAPQSTPEKGVSKWRSPDRIDTIVNYYQQKWQGSDWQVIQPFELDPQNNNQTAIVSQDNLDFTILLTPSEQNSSEATNLTIIYQAANAQSSADAETSISITDNQADNNDSSQSNNSSETTQDDNQQLNFQTNNTTSNQPSLNSVTDLAEVPEQLSQSVKDVIALGVITPKLKDPETNSFEFKPNEPITRREYAKWLVAANNKYYADSPSKKIRIAGKSTDVAFKDITANDPDFPEIQGLAEAGLIPSMLTNDSSNLLFKPDAPLTREDLITWKVPLDFRKALPEADANAIKEAWGFQDASSIDVLALKPLFADYQNGDRSNINRIFGYTTLFQPKKAVTRAEAAASLDYFGFQGDGITAKETMNLAE